MESSGHTLASEKKLDAEVYDWFSFAMEFPLVTIFDLPSHQNGQACKRSFPIEVLLKIYPARCVLGSYMPANDRGKEASLADCD